MVQWTLDCGDDDGFTTQNRVLIKVSTIPRFYSNIQMPQEMALPAALCPGHGKSHHTSELDDGCGITGIEVVGGLPPAGTLNSLVARRDPQTCHGSLIGGGNG